MTNSLFRRRFLVFAILAIGALIISGAAFAYVTATTQRVTLDVNPSVELEINCFDRVTKIMPINDDAQKLLEGYSPRSKNINQVVEDIFGRMVTAGYLNDYKKMISL